MVVRGMAEIEDLSVRPPALVAQDAHQAVDPVVDVREAAALPAPVDEGHRLAAEEVAEELREHARAPLLGGVDRIEPWPDPVERPAERALEPLVASEGDDHAVHELL